MTLEKVAGLRWREPRRAAELAQEVLQEAAASGDAGTWLRAAGWLLHGRSAVGDAREVALDLLADIDTRAGRDVLRRPEAARLRVELAALAQANGDPEIARDLVDRWESGDPAAGPERDELDLDRLAVLVRCALVDGADELADLRAAVEALSQRLHGEPEALAELLLGSVHRDDGEPAAAAERALRGLARLGWTPASPSIPPRSPHLGCALLSQWATSLLEDGAAADIPDGVKQLEVVDGGRHGVLWRLAVARAFAGRARPTADVLEDAASAAAAVDAPSLEAACRSAQAELYEGAGRYQDALSAVRAAMDAERTDRERAERLREALAGPADALADVADREPRALSWSATDRDAVPGTDGISPWAGPRTVLEIGEPSGAADVAHAGSADIAAPELAAAELDAASEAPADAADGTAVAGPALSTLDIGAFDDLAVRADDAANEERRIDDEDGPGGSATDLTGHTADVLGAEPPAADVRPAVAPDLVPDESFSPLPGSRGADGESGEGSPLADALLAELNEVVREVSGATPSRPPSAGTDAAGNAATAVPDTPLDVDEPDAPPQGARRDPWIVLDLVADDGRPVQHPEVADVGADLASRASRLVPENAEVRGSDDSDDRVVPDSAAEIMAAGAEGVAVQLWARSLLRHLASRVSRRGLPEGTLLRARVHGTDGVIGDAEMQALSAPTPAAAPVPGGGEPAGREPDAAGRSTVVRPAVQPGSGGRRRRASGDEASVEPAAPRNGFSAEHLRPADPTTNGAGRHGSGEPSTDSPVVGGGGRRRREDRDAESTHAVDGGPAQINGPRRRRADGSADGTTESARTESTRTESSITTGRAGRSGAAGSGWASDTGPADGRTESSAPMGRAGQSGAAEPGSVPDAGSATNGRSSRLASRRAATTLPEGGRQATSESVEEGGGRPTDGTRPGAAGSGEAVDNAVVAGSDAATGRGVTDADGRVGDGPTAHDGADDGHRVQAADDATAGDAADDGDGATAGGSNGAVPAALHVDGPDLTDGVPVGERGPAVGAGGNGRAIGRRSTGGSADVRPARRPDPLDTSVAVEDVVPDGAMWLKGEWIVPAPLEQAAVDSVRNGGSAGPPADQPAPETLPGPSDREWTSNGRGSHRADRRVPGGASEGHDRSNGNGSGFLADRPGGERSRSERADARAAGADRVGPAGLGTDQPGSGAERIDRAGIEGALSEPVDPVGFRSGRAGDDEGGWTAVVEESGPSAVVEESRSAGTGDERRSAVGADRAGGRRRREVGRVADVGEPGPTDGAGEVGRTSDGGDGGPESDDGNEPSRREAATGSSSRRERRPRTERRSGRTPRGRDVPATGGDPTAIPDDLGLGDLLAGALAAYRDI